MKNLLLSVAYIQLGVKESQSSYSGSPRLVKRVYNYTLLIYREKKKSLLKNITGIKNQCRVNKLPTAQLRIKICAYSRAEKFDNGPHILIVLVTLTLLASACLNTFGAVWLLIDETSLHTWSQKMSYVYSEITSCPGAFCPSVDFPWGDLPADTSALSNSMKRLGNCWRAVTENHNHYFDCASCSSKDQC